MSLRITGLQLRIGVACCGLGMAESEENSAVQFFEGVEKLLEIWFTRTDGNSKQCDLRKIPR
jgi:S-adenosylmethionine decarboxylase